MKESWKNWNCTEVREAKILNALERGSTRLAQNSKSDMHHACMITWPITWLITWYDDITSCERSSWLHDGHVVCRHNIILDPICRAANIINSHFPALRKVGHNQNLSLLLTSLCPNEFWPKVFLVTILKDFEKFLQTHLSSRKSSISRKCSKTFSPAKLS